MFDPIIVMFKYLTREFLLQSFRREQVITKNQSVTKRCRFRPHFGMIRLMPSSSKIRASSFGRLCLPI